MKIRILIAVFAVVSIGTTAILLLLDGKGKHEKKHDTIEMTENNPNPNDELIGTSEKMDEEILIKEARKFNFLYIPLKNAGDIAVMSNGSGMLMSTLCPIGVGSGVGG